MKQPFKTVSRWTIIALIIIFSIVNAADAVFAADAGSYGGKPVRPGEGNDHTSQWFIYKSLPIGEKREDSIRIINNSDNPLTLKLYPADSAKSSDGGFALEQEVEERDEVGKWIVLSKDEVTVEAHAEEEVPFTIQIPEDAKIDAGEHAGGILIQEKKEIPKLIGGGIQLSTRVGVRVYVTVPGTIKEEIAVDSFALKQRTGERHTEWAADIYVKNSGTVREDVTIVTRIEPVYSFLDTLFDRGHLLPANNERGMQVLRDDTLRSSFEFTTPTIAYVKATATVVYQDQKGAKQTVKSDDVYQWILPPQKQLILISVVSLIAVIALVLLVIAIVRLVKRLRRAMVLLKTQENSQESEVDLEPEKSKPKPKPVNKRKKKSSPKKKKKENEPAS